MPRMDDLARVHATAWDILDGAPSGDAIRALCDGIGGATGIASLIDARTGVGMDCGFARVDPALVDVLVTRYATPATNPTLRAIPRMPPGRLLHQSRVIDPATLRGSAFYEEWWRPTGVREHAGALSLPAPDGRFAFVSVARLGGRDWLDDGETRFVEAAATAIARAMRTVAAIGRAEGEAALAACGPAAAWLLDGAAEILLDNAGARDACAQARTLRQQGRRLVPRTVVADIRLRRTVAEVVRGTRGHGHVPLSVGDRARLIVQPGPTYRGTATALVTLDRPPCPDWDAAALAAAFDLTPREADVALALAAGHRPAEAAAAMGLAPSSVRIYLKRIYAKTGVHGQAPLVAKLLRGG